MFNQAFFCVHCWFARALTNHSSKNLLGVLKWYFYRIDVIPVADQSNCSTVGITDLLLLTDYNYTDKSVKKNKRLKN